MARIKPRWTLADMPPQTGRHVLITGANRGLGYDMAQALATSGARVTMAVRNVTVGELARARILERAPRAAVSVHGINLENLVALRAFSARVKAELPPVDVLIHNAGVVLEPFGLTEDGFERHIGVNFLAPLVLTLSLLDHMRRGGGARVVFIASLAHRLARSFAADDFTFANAPYAPMEAYARSKLAVLLLTLALNRRFAAAGMDVAAMPAHPGYSFTNGDKGGWVIRTLTRLIAQPVARGALPLLYAAVMPGVSPGAYIGPGGLGELRGYPALARRSALAADAALAEQLWAAACAAAGTRFVGDWAG